MAQVSKSLYDFSFIKQNVLKYWKQLGFKVDVGSIASCESCSVGSALSQETSLTVGSLVEEVS